MRIFPQSNVKTNQVQIAPDPIPLRRGIHPTERPAWFHIVIVIGAFKLIDMLRSVINPQRGAALVAASAVPPAHAPTHCSGRSGLQALSS
jgi:hypothetical protein